ncbi:MAG: RsmD family RNA methyltransferase [Candidatus Micrarchaeota archaeon]|nr:RsmD family RNA methyltransferase [Candidatus Micrarchaeota archaeon]
MIREKGLDFFADGVFYNPHMELSRTLSSLAVDSIDDKLRVLDAFSASGIRGIRYAKECRNIESIDFLDSEHDAIKAIRKNMKLHKIKGKTIEHEAIHYMINSDPGKYNFVELDPFGSPSPYFHSAIRAMRNEKTAYLSATATDTAVLCGSSADACPRYYHSKPMLNDFCHETGLRILIRRAMESAHEFNFGIEPLLCFYYRHQMKIILKLRKGADGANENIKNIGYVFSGDYDGVRVEFSRKPICSLKKYYDYAGPLWIGDLCSRKTADACIKKAEDDEKKILKLIKGEMGYPPFFVTTSSLGKMQKRGIPGMEKLFDRLKENGVKAVKTHFERNGIKYKGKIEDVIRAFDSV